MTNETNVIPFKRPEKGSRHAEAVEKIAAVISEVRDDGIDDQDLLIALGYHFANMGIMMGATRGDVLDVMCLLYDSPALKGDEE